MQPGKFNVVLDQAWGSSGKGALSSRLVDIFNVRNVSSANYPNAGHCQTFDAIIPTDRGLKKLGDIVTQNQKGLQLLNMDGCWESPTDLVDDGVRVVNKIKLKNGIEYKCTDIHQYYVWDPTENAPQWIRSMDLVPGVHQFLFPKKTNWVGTSLPIDMLSLIHRANGTALTNKPDELLMAEYLGLLVGDGCYSPKKANVSIAFHSDQMDVCCKTQKFYDGIGIPWNVYKVKDKQCHVLETCSISELRQIFEQVGLKLATKAEKEIPTAVTVGTPEIIGAFLRGLFDSDGSAKKRRVSFGNISKDVVLMAQQLLLLLGINSTYRSYQDKRPSRSRSHQIEMAGLENLTLFRERVGFLSEVKSARLNVEIATYDADWSQGSLINLNYNRLIQIRKAAHSTNSTENGAIAGAYVLRNAATLRAAGFTGLVKLAEDYHVVDIKEVNLAIGEERVFDVTMPQTHSYLANGAISHNTIAHPNLKDGKFVAKALPTACGLKKALGREVAGWISPGSSFRWEQFIKEYEECGGPDLYVHDRAGIVTEDHAAREREGAESTKHLASTMQGSGTALADKVLRKQNVPLVGNTPAPIDLPGNIQITNGMAFRDATHKIISKGDYWLHEGSQGYALSIDHGSHYPNCTSRNCTVQAAMDYMAIPPNMVGDVYLNLRSHPIRVGNVYDESGKELGNSGGWYPDQQELTWDEIAKRANMPEEEAKMLAERERTTVTKRIRRVGTFSQIGLKDAARTCGATKLVLNFVNQINHIDVGLRGGKEALVKFSSETRAFIDMLENCSGLPVVMVGTSALHDDYVYLG